MPNAGLHRETLTRIAPAGVVLSDALWSDLASRHGEAHRHYHTLDHIVAFAGHFADVDGDIGWSDPISTYLALLYHDVIYDPARSDNEARSAEHALACLGNPAIWAGTALSQGSLETIVRLIDLTALHGRVDATVLSADQRLFLDADMSILGTPSVVYARYEAQVRAEYASVYPPNLYAQGRTTFLRTTLDNRPIFLSDYFGDRFEDTALRNLQHTLATYGQKRVHT
jgi:predicted metal-dependent HD superfamily phosphohydrolase